MTISDIAREQVFGSEGGGFLELLTLSHSSLAEPLRFVNNIENVTSNGETYIAFPFRVTLPSDQDRSPPAARLEIDNVSREIAQIIRSISTPPTIEIVIIRLDDLDAIEQTFPPFQLRNVRYTATIVSGELVVDDIMREPFPQRSFTPSEYPGLF